MSGSIEVVSPGILTTVQDLGRPGYGPLGVSIGGAADPFSMRAGNLLAGNSEGAAALEMTLKGGSFRFPDGAMIVLTGAELAGAPMWTRFRVPPGGTLALGHVASGLRTYLCVRGGLDVPRVLGSASMHLPSGLGGGPVARGQRISIGAASSCADLTAGAFDPSAFQQVSFRKVLRVTRGPQFDWFEPDVLTAAAYDVTPDSNRSGLRLRGASRVVSSKAAGMVTEGVSLGAVQIPPSGEPIILFVDQQTTGGYPVAANVIAADLSSLGQLRPGDQVRFETVSMAEARRLYFEQEALLSRINGLKQPTLE